MELSLSYKCPVTLLAPNDLKLIRSLSNTFVNKGITDIVLDPGTFPDEGLSVTLNNLTMIRRLAIEKRDGLFGFTMIGIPAIVWVRPAETREATIMKESYMASALIARYASILIMHSLDAWALLPPLVWRQSLYTDPRRPARVEPGLREIGKPNEISPVMITSNFAITYHTVSSDIESGKIDAWLLVVDTGGLAVQTAVAGKALTAEKVASLMRESGIENKVKHRKLIIPGLAAKLKGEIEELTGWEVLVGPIDSSGIPDFLRKEWKVF
jgi:acetyl-CoA decarbonylase/synthase complex subunit gamma